VLDHPCIGCGRRGPSESHHFPLTRRFGTATVPLCRVCHTAAHWGRLTERLIERAPAYWKAAGEWESNHEVFERWLAKREYRRATGGRLWMR